MKRTKKQFTVDRIVPESEGKLHIKVGIHLLLSLCLCLGSLSVLHAEGNEYPSISAMVYLLMIATLVCCVLSQRKREKQWMKVFYYGGPWLLVLILTGFHGYWTGAKSWINMILMYWNEVHDGGVALLSVSQENVAMQSFTLLMVIFCAQFCWWMVKDRKVICGIGYSMAWTMLALMTGMFQPYMGMLFLIGLAGLFLAIQGGYVTARNLFCFVVVSVIVVIGGLTLPQENLDSVTQARQQWKEQIRTWRYGEDSLPEGDLRQAASLQKNSNEMLQVQTGQQKMLYLRGFVGEVYQNGVWHELPSYTYGNENAGIMKWFLQQGFHPQMQVAEYYALCSEDNQPEENELSISVTDASRYYFYLPVSMEEVNGSNYKEKRSSRLFSTDWRGAGSYSGTELSGSRPAELTVAEDWVSDPTTEAQKQYCQTESVYRDFVYENYTQTDADTVKLMNEIFWDDYDPESDGIYSALSQVRAVLNNNVKYVEKPMAAPESYDPIRYFLTKSRQGNSMLYASAAVESLRVHGIPARYVEGYFVSEEQSAANGGKVSLTGKDAHAWVEVYFDGIGWLPVDVTPGYYFDSVSLQQMVSLPDTVQKNAALSNNGYDTNIVKNSGNQGSKAPEILKKVFNVAAICLGIVGLLVILLTAIFVVLEILRILAEYIWQQHESYFSDSERIGYKTKKIYHLLAIRGIDASLGWNMEDTDTAIADTFSETSPGEYKRVCVLLEKAAYGGMILKQFEERTVDAFLTKISEVDKKSNWRIRLRLRYDAVYCLRHYK